MLTTILVGLVAVAISVALSYKVANLYWRSERHARRYNLVPIAGPALVLIVVFSFFADNLMTQTHATWICHAVLIAGLFSGVAGKDKAQNARANEKVSDGES